MFTVMSVQNKGSFKYLIVTLLCLHEIFYNQPDVKLQTTSLKKDPDLWCVMLPNRAHADVEEIYWSNVSLNQWDRHGNAMEPEIFCLLNN